MVITTVQWNIGGGFIRSKNSDKTADFSYDKEGLPYIIGKLEETQPDIITLQEAHESKESSQTKEIVKNLGFKYFVTNSYDNSHLDSNARLSQSIISRYPLKNHKYQMFINPGYKIIINGKEYPCHNKGITSVDTEIDGDVMGGTSLVLHLETLHLIPFGRTNIDPLSEEAREYRDDISSKIANNSKRLLLQGDFNFDSESLKQYISIVFSEGTKEVLQKVPTRATGKHYDHIIYRGMKLVETKVLRDALTDHFPIISRFNLP